MSYPQQPWGQPPGWPPQQPPPGWGQPPAPAPQNRAAIGCGVLFVLCCVFGVCVKMVARTGGGPSRSTPPPSVARAAPAVAERDASLDERLNSMPVQERMNLIAAGFSILDPSVERAAAVGQPPINALYVTRRCNRSWPRHFALRQMADKTVGEALRERGFVAVRCLTRLELGATYYAYALVP